MTFTRVIPLDGRPSEGSLKPPGAVIRFGKSEDALVIDTVGLKEWWLEDPHPKGSLWHSDAAHIMERVKWIAPNVISTTLP